MRSISVLVLILTLILISCSKDPRSVEIPNDLSALHSNQEFMEAIEQLSEEDKEMLMAHVLMRAVSSIFTEEGEEAENKITIGKALDAQKEYLEQQKREEIKQKALAEELRRKQTEKAKEMNETVTTSLLALTFQKANYNAGIYSDYFQIRIGIQNNTDKNIRGVRGSIVLSDIFGETIKRIRLSYDNGIKPNSAVTYRGTLDYNQFMSEDNKLRTTKFENIKYLWEPLTYIFADGSTMDMPL